MDRDAYLDLAHYEVEREGEEPNGPAQNNDQDNGQDQDSDQEMDQGAMGGDPFDFNPLMEPIHDQIPEVNVIPINTGDVHIVHDNVPFVRVGAATEDMRTAIDDLRMQLIALQARVGNQAAMQPIQINIPHGYAGGTINVSVAPPGILGSIAAFQARVDALEARVTANEAAIAELKTAVYEDEDEE